VIELCFHADFEVMVGRWGEINLIFSDRWVARTMANQNHRNGRGNWCWCRPVGAVYTLCYPWGDRTIPSGLTAVASWCKDQVVIEAMEVHLQPNTVNLETGCP